MEGYKSISGVRGERAAKGFIDGKNRVSIKTPVFSGFDGEG